MKRILALLCVLIGLSSLFGDEAGWQGTVPLVLFDNTLLNATAACTSSVFQIPENATGYFAVEYAAHSSSSTAEYKLYFQIRYPRLRALSSTYYQYIEETFNWDTVWITPALGILQDSIQVDSAHFQALPALRAADIRVIITGLTNNPADTRVSARIIADVGQ
jgi:hypothetical protein